MAETARVITQERAINLSKEKAVVCDEDRVIVFSLKSGMGMIFTKDELVELETARKVML